MVNGRDDYHLSVERQQLPLFRLLGTREPRKRHALLEGGHLPPRTAVAREILDWLDQYLGPVKLKTRRSPGRPARL
jgi:hypothetical protein